MSRIGKLPVPIPQDVEITDKGSFFEVSGAKGKLTVAKHRKINYFLEDNAVVLQRVDDSKVAKEQHGLRRTLLNNAVVGVSQGFEKGLELVGVGYRVQVQQNKVVLNVGYSHAQEYTLPEGISARAEGNRLFISGTDKESVGEVAATIRRIRPPEPYKGKGIKYINEQLVRKAGKSAKK